MTEEEFSKAAREAGWDEKWIQDVIEDARLDADIERAKKQRKIAIPVPFQLGGLWPFVKHGPTYPEARTV